MFFLRLAAFTIGLAGFMVGAMAACATPIFFPQVRDWPTRTTVRFLGMTLAPTFACIGLMFWGRSGGQLG